VGVSPNGARIEESKDNGLTFGLLSGTYQITWVVPVENKGYLDLYIDGVRIPGTSSGVDVERDRESSSIVPCTNTVMYVVAGVAGASNQALQQPKMLSIRNRTPEILEVGKSINFGQGQNRATLYLQATLTIECISP
jgi:hypothetical protein